MTNESVSRSFSDLQIMAAQAALAKMANSAFFSICDVDRIMVMIGGNKQCAAYKLLNALHCVDWGMMAPELRSALPSLLREVFEVDDRVDFSEVFQRRTRTVDVSPKPSAPTQPTKSFFKRLIS